MGVINLRDYQEDGLQDLRRGLLAGHKRQVLCSPTGSGKTLIAAKLMENVKERGLKASFIVDRVNLVEQTSQSLMEYGLVHGIQQGLNTQGRLLPLQVCSAQTLESRKEFPAVDVAIYDEAHTQRRLVMQALYNRGVTVVGLTATPFAPGMGQFYTRLVNLPPTNQLIEDGWLSGLRVYSCKEINMKSAATNNAGEWLDSEVEKRTIPIVGDIVSEWIRHTTRNFGGPVKTLVYTATVASGTEICRQFNAAGFRFEQVSYLDRSDNSRKAKIAGFRKGPIMGLVSCEALIKGADFKFVQCLADARPYRTSYMAHIQKLGRGMRICPEIDKQFCLLLDFAGNYLRHAEVTEKFWAEGCLQLSDEDNEERKSKSLKKPDESRACVCGFIMESTAQVCPKCGRQRQRRRQRVVTKPGRMEEVKTLSQEVGDLWPHVSAYALERKKKEGPEAALKMARGLFKDLTKSWPAWERQLEPVQQCDPRVREKIVRLQRQKYIIRTKMQAKARGRK